MKQGKGKNHATYSRVLLRSWKNVSNNFIFNVLDRLCLFGDGASEAGRRRDWATHRGRGCEEEAGARGVQEAVERHSAPWI